MKNDCVFCGIVRGEIPARRIYEDTHALVFLDVAGDMDGHLLAIPKAHVASVLDADAAMLARLAEAVGKVARHLCAHCGYDGVNLLNASGEAAGQSVPHLHVHILPRKRGDGVDAWPQLPGAREDMDALRARLNMTETKGED